MKLYIAIVEDRHIDVEVQPFTTPEAAIAYARTQAEANDRGYVPDEDDEDIGEQEIEGYVYYATYSPEGDSVSVVERDLDAP